MDFCPTCWIFVSPISWVKKRIVRVEKEFLHEVTTGLHDDLGNVM